MKNTNTKPKSLLLSAVLVILVSVALSHFASASFSAETKKEPAPTKITDGKVSKFGFISHTIDCPRYFKQYQGMYSKNGERLT